MATDTQILVSFGNNLKKARLCSPGSPSAAAVARQIDGFTNQMLLRFEAGSNSPNIKQLYRLCEFYGVSADKLLGLPEGGPLSGSDDDKLRYIANLIKDARDIG